MVSLLIKYEKLDVNIINIHNYEQFIKSLHKYLNEIIHSIFK